MTQTTHTFPAFATLRSLAKAAGIPEVYSGPNWDVRGGVVRWSVMPIGIGIDSVRAA